MSAKKLATVWSKWDILTNSLSRLTHPVESAAGNVGNIQEAFVLTSLQAVLGRLDHHKLLRDSFRSIGKHRDSYSDVKPVHNTPVSI